MVNDASTDETAEILKDYDDILRAINLKENVGLSEARNIGIRKSLGRFVVFLDADDYIHRDMLLMQYNFLTLTQKFDACAVDYLFVDEDEKHMESASVDEAPIACGIMYSKDNLFDVGLYDTKFKAREEEDFRIRYLKKYDIHRIPLPLYRYRRHKSNLTNNEEVMDHYLEMLKEKHGPEA